jgi:hypothetical protein
MAAASAGLLIVICSGMDLRASRETSPVMAFTELAYPSPSPLISIISSVGILESEPY